MKRTCRVMLAILLTLAFFPTAFVQARQGKARNKAQSATTLSPTVPATRRARVAGRRTQRRVSSSAVATGPGGGISTGPRSRAVAALPVTHEVKVNADGTFDPAHIRIKPGDTVRWVNLRREDAIVQIANPASNETLGADPCGINDNKVDHAFAGSDPNEFTGPKRYGVSGVFSLGPNGPGFKKVPKTTKCACELDPDGCKAMPASAGNDKLCPEEGRPYESLNATWNNPDITGVIIRLNWKDIQNDDGGTLKYHWQDLNREMNQAVQHGKLFTLDVRAGAEGTPDWIFKNHTGPAGPGPVTRHKFRDWASGDVPKDNCGFNLSLGSPVDPNYQALYVAMINALAAHVASDSRWFQALAHVKVSGANLFSSEARLPSRCYDSDDADKKLDNINGHDCLCNSRIWADSGYTPEGLFQFYRVVGNAIYNAFYKRKSLGYQLIQAGFPRVRSATNFEGDSLKDQSGVPLLTPSGTTSDDLNGVVQTATILEQGRDGRFVEPFSELINEVEGGLFVVQHSGLGRLPEDDEVRSCPQHQEVFPALMAGSFPKAKFPIGKIAGGQGEGCPNPWAVNEGTLHNQIMGFQTNNANQQEGVRDTTGHTKGVVDPFDVESALWNMTINSNGVFIELYEERLWEISQKRGSGAAADVLAPKRTTSLAAGNPAPYTKNLYTWLVELHDRRKQLASLIDNPYAADPFPTIYEHTFSGPVISSKTYYYINPWKCATTPGSNRVGFITVSGTAP